MRAHVLYSVLVTRLAHCRTRHSSTQTQLEAELRDALDAVRTNQAASGENETRSRSREEALRRELTQLQLVCSCTVYSTVFEESVTPLLYEYLVFCYYG